MVHSTSEADSTRRLRTAFEMEALPHLPVLYGLALCLTGGHELESEDLVQEALLRAYANWLRYESGTNCRAWLITILRDLFINGYHTRQRRGGRVGFSELDERVDVDDLSSATSEERFDRRRDNRVVAAIDSLSDPFRLPLVLSDLLGLGYAEIADLLEIPCGSVKSRLYRARRSLRGQLRDYARSRGYRWADDGGLEAAGEGATKDLASSSATGAGTPRCHNLRGPPAGRER